MITNLKRRNFIVQVTALSLGSMTLGACFNKGKGKNNLHDWNVYRDSLIPSGKFCKLFEKEFGSTMCHDIQETKFGRSFQLTNPEDLREFQEADATDKCSSVVRKAVRIAAEIILDDTKGIL